MYGDCFRDRCAPALAVRIPQRRDKHDHEVRGRCLSHNCWGLRAAKKAVLILHIKSECIARPMCKISAGNPFFDSKARTSHIMQEIGGYTLVHHPIRTVFQSRCAKFSGMRIETDGQYKWRLGLYDQAGDLLNESTRAVVRSTAHVSFLPDAACPLGDRQARGHDRRTRRNPLDV